MRKLCQRAAVYNKAFKNNDLCSKLSLGVMKSSKYRQQTLPRACRRQLSAALWRSNPLPGLQALGAAPAEETNRSPAASNAGTSIEEAVAMVKQRFVAILLLLAAAPAWSAGAAEQEEGLLEGMVNPGYHEQPAWFKQSFLDIREDVQEAASNDKRVLLYFYQDGCPYC
jgi:hypothetical protein